jgi:outer membrane usher protein
VLGEAARVVALVAALSCTALGIARADPPADAPEATPGPAQATPGVPAFLDLLINLLPGEPVLVLLADDGDVWVAVEDLVQARLTGFSGRRVVYEGRELVSLRSLEPELRFDADETDLALRITAGPALLGRVQLDLRSQARPANLVFAPSPGAFLNYSVTGTSDLHASDRRRNPEQLSGVAELGLTAGRGLLLNTGSLLPDGEVVRGTSTLTYDRLERLQRFTVGDQVAAGDALGGSTLVAGFGAAKDLSLDPYFVQAPLPTASVFASSPSVLEVWVNGQLVRELPVSPGSLELANIPVTGGTSDVRTVLRDAFGRRQETDTTQYLASGQLARGLSDWSVQAGAIRRSFGTESFDYGAPLLMARGRRGLSNLLTGALRLEASVDGRGRALVSSGGSLITATPYGELEAGLAASRDDERPGAAGLLAWRFGSRWFSTTTHLRLLSDHYAHASLAAVTDRDLWRAGVTFGAPSRWGSFAIDYTAGHARSGGLVERGGIRLSFPMGGGGTFLLSASGSRGPNQPAEALVLGTAIFSLGRRTSGDTGVESRVSDAPRPAMSSPKATAGVQRSLPSNSNGFGYRLRGAADPEGSTFTGTLEGQASFARLEATVTRAPTGDAAGFATASGGIATAGGKVFFTRALRQGFALVRVPGVPNVRTYFENQLVGRTDADGDILVSGFLPYYGHRLSIDDDDVPVTYAVRGIEQTVAAPNRGVTTVRFDVRRVLAVTGRLVARGVAGATPPAYGTLTVELVGGAVTSPIGVDGAFWLEELPAGHHPAQIVWKHGTCGFTLSVPGEASTDIVDLGVVGCAVPE